MCRSKTSAGALALLSVLVACAAQLLIALHLLAWVPIAMFGVSAAVAVVAWIALGAPVTRASLRRRPE